MMVGSVLTQAVIEQEIVIIRVYTQIAELARPASLPFPNGVLTDQIKRVQPNIKIRFHTLPPRSSER
jgi:hypothetical protein